MVQCEMLNMINSDIEMVDEMNVAGKSDVYINNYQQNSIKSEIEESIDGSSTNASDASSLNASSENDVSESDHGSSSEESISDVDQEPTVEMIEQMYERNNDANIQSSSSSSVVFALQTIQVVAEQSNIESNLTEGAAKMISEDISYRIRELIHCSSQFMRHSFRNKLSTKDVVRAMHELDCDVILGHSNALDNESNEPYNYYINVPLANVFIENDTQIDLKRQVVRFLRNSRLPGQQSTKKDNTFEVEWLMVNNSICDNNKPDASNNNQDKILNQYFNKLIETLLAYKRSTISCLEIEQCQKIFYNDLCKNHTIGCLLCPLMYFIRNSLNSWNHISTRIISSSNELRPSAIRFHHSQNRLIITFLNALRCLIRNEELVEWTLHRKFMYDFADLLLMLCFKPFPCLTFQSYYQLFQQILQIRSGAAFLFTQLLFKYSLPFTDIQHQLILMLNNRIKNRANNNSPNVDLLNISSIDYAIVNLYRLLGFDMCLRYLVPMLTDEHSFFNEYFTGQHNNLTSSIKHSAIVNEVDSLIKMEINLVGQLIIKGILLLITQKANDFIIIDHSDRIYTYFSDRYADSYCCSIHSIIDMPSVIQNRAVWFDNWKTFFPKRSKLRKQQKETKSEEVMQTSTEKSPNKTHKKKGTGLLESMLSTDTTKMPKNESLSIFTDSLFITSHKHYDKIVLYQNDFDDQSINSGLISSGKYLVLFDGQRLPQKTTEQTTDESQRKIRQHAAPIPYTNSLWYRLNIDHPHKRTMHLPCSRNIHHTSYFDYQINNTNNQSAASKNRTKKPSRHKLFHYHRIRQHLRTNCSLYTIL